MIALVKGQKVKLSLEAIQQPLEFSVSMSPSTAWKAGFAVVGLDANGRLPRNDYALLGPQQQSPCGALTIAVKANAMQLRVQPTRLPREIRRVSIMLSLPPGCSAKTIRKGMLSLEAPTVEKLNYEFSGDDFSDERTLVLAELYENSGWRFCIVGQGTSDDLPSTLRTLGAVVKVVTSSNTTSLKPSPSPLPSSTAVHSPPIVQQPIPPKALGWLDGLLGTLKQMRDKRAARLHFESALMRAVADGQLTSQEIGQLDQIAASAGLTPEDVCRARVQAYAKAYGAIASDRRISATEEAELRKIQAYLGLNDSQVGDTSRDLARLRLLGDLADGILPVISTPSVNLQRGEDAHWLEPGELLEERVVRRTYRGGSQGVSIRIAKGLTYRVGGNRGQSVSETAVVPISQGNLVITSKRVMFSGDRRSFTLKLSEIVESEAFRDGLRINDGGTKPKLIRLLDASQVDVVALTLRNALNRLP